MKFEACNNNMLDVLERIASAMTEIRDLGEAPNENRLFYVILRLSFVPHNHDVHFSLTKILFNCTSSLQFCLL